MEAGTWNASVQFGNYAYNMSAVTAEQTEMRSTMIQGESINKTFDDIEFIGEKFDDGYDLQDIEIIAIDPDSFYTSPSGSSDSDSTEEENDEQESQISTNNAFDVVPFEMQAHADADFDIITLNIDDDFPIDPQDDDILFKNDHHFDLASYIGGESTSLLLSPVNDAANLRNRMKSINYPAHSKQTVTELSRALMNATHDKVTKTPASNRRKRKNLSREFIESSDSDEDNKTNNANSIDDSKRNKASKLQKDNDPVWCPPSEKRTAKAPKQTGGRAKEIVNRQELKDIKNAAKSATNGQGKGLRNMLKQQLLSDRPVNKSKLLKTMAPTISSSEKLNTTTVAQIPVKKVGVGRGKDIAITAKYYNCTESSDNSERDKPYKYNRYHQIYTDSDDSNSDIDVSSEPSPLPKVIIKEKEDLVADNDKSKEIKEEKEVKEIEERRIVYVGRLEEELTKEELRRKFSVYGHVKLVSLHYKETKMKYGFVTFARPCDAFTAIDDSPKNPAICQYDISFGGRRAFCREKYFDLDNTGHTTYREDPIVPQTISTDEGDSFDVLLRKMKEKLQETKK